MDQATRDELLVRMDERLLQTGDFVMEIRHDGKKLNGRVDELEKTDVDHGGRIDTLEDRPGVVKQSGIITAILGALIAVKEFLFK